MRRRVAARGIVGLVAGIGLLVAVTFGVVAVAAASSKRAATPSAPCVFVPGGSTSCASSDPKVSVDFLNSVDTTGCTFSVTIDWGDASAAQTVPVTGSRQGQTLLATHVYSAPGSYTIGESGRVLSGHCAVSATSYHVTVGPVATAPTPVRGQRVVLVLVSGTILVREPGATGFVALTGTLAVPVGTDVQATQGVVRVVVIETGSSSQSALVYGGWFLVTQSSAPPYVTVFALSEPLTGCAGESRSVTGQTASIDARPPTGAAKPTKRHLWVKDQGGKYETTTGQVSGSNVGTQWLTSQDCTSSQIRVVSGTVSVFDQIDGTTTTVHAHQSYRASVGEQESALGPVISYWAAINAHAFARAWGYVVPGTIGSRQGFVDSETATGVESASFTGVVSSSTTSTATVRVIRLVTVDHRFGCRDWSGSYAVILRSRRWLIARANITPRRCP